MFGYFWGLLPVVALLWIGSTEPVAAQEIKTCSDFTYQEDAQAAWDRGEGRPEDWYGGWDQDGDGIACESLPSKPFHKQAWFWPGIGILGLTLASGGVVVARRSGARATPTTTPSVQNDSAESRQTQSADSAPAPATVPTVINNVYTTVDSHSSSRSISTNHNRNENVVSGDDSSYRRMTPEKAKNMPYEKYLRSSYWQAVRRNNIARSGGRCKDCGRSDQVLQVHHLSYEFLGREDDDFLVVLCAGCHKKRHNIPPPPEVKMNA